MDVAQALNASVATGPPVSPIAPKPPRSPFAPPPIEENDHQRDPGGWGEAENERTITPAIMKAERRRSTIEKYSNFMLPVLPEEKTPMSSPVGTLKGANVPVYIDGAGAGAEVEEDNKQVQQSAESRAEKPSPPKKPDFVRAPSKIHIGT